MCPHFFVAASDCVKVAHLSYDDNVQQEHKTEKGKEKEREREREREKGGKRERESERGRTNERGEIDM